MTDRASSQIPRLSEKYNIAIREDRQIEQRVLQNLGQEFGVLRSGIHVSDLVLCLRQAAFRKLRPVPFTLKQLGYFLDGARRHEALQRLYSQNDPAHIINEKKGIFEDVSYSIDIYHSIPIEFKTTRSNSVISDHWIRQLAYYMLAVNSNIGILQLQRIMARREDGIFPAFLVEFSTEIQRTTWLREFRKRRDLLHNALVKKDPALAPIERGEGRWVCRDCQYSAECDIIELQSHVGQLGQLGASNKKLDNCRESEGVPP
ncbi:MAG TPA: hypothetical protein VFF30_18395 [Nitrososphaerales archaeon]|nr:hypothetical protein [Nitrososphaerales archaeon]